MKQFENDKVTLDAGCAERSCACYSPQFGDTGGVPHYPETVVAQLLDRIAELEKAITNYRTACDMQEEVIKKLEKDNKELHAIAQRMAMAESDARKSLQSYKDAQEK